MIRAIVYIIFGVLGIFCTPYVLDNIFADVLPYYLLAGISIIGLIFYGLVCYLGVIKLCEIKDWK